MSRGQEVGWREERGEGDGRADKGRLFRRGGGETIKGQRQGENLGPSLISRTVSVDVKHHVYLLT